MLLAIYASLEVDFFFFGFKIVFPAENPLKFRKKYFQHQSIKKKKKSHFMEGNTYSYKCE